MDMTFAEKRQDKRFNNFPENKYEVDIDAGTGFLYKAHIKDIGMGGIGLSLTSNKTLPNLRDQTVLIKIFDIQGPVKKELLTIESTVRWISFDNKTLKAAIGLHFELREGDDVEILKKIIKESA